MPLIKYDVGPSIKPFQWGIHDAGPSIKHFQWREHDAGTWMAIKGRKKRFWTLYGTLPVEQMHARKVSVLYVPLNAQIVYSSVSCLNSSFK